MADTGTVPALAPAVRPRRGVRGVVGLCLLFVLLAAGYAGYREWSARNGAVPWVPLPPGPPKNAIPFTGNPVDGMPGTVVAPTLNTLMPPQKNVLWCASFQLAWNRLKNGIIRKPVLVAGAEKLANALNEGTSVEGDLPPHSCYAIAGYEGNGILKRIVRDMQRQFPFASAPILDPTGQKDTIHTFAYLRAGVKFPLPYTVNPLPFTFTDSQGKSSQVTSFGLVSYGESPDPVMREQPRVLYCPNAVISQQNPGAEFVIDLCRNSKPCQVMLACVKPQGTLEATYRHVEKLIARGDESGLDGRLNETDTLVIPDVVIRLMHRFTELEDKDLLNPGFREKGYFIKTALQTIDFTLNKGGAQVASEGYMAIPLCPPRDLHFNRPFLLALKQRGCQRPFFLLWVENAEVLQATAP